MHETFKLRVFTVHGTETFETYMYRLDAGFLILYEASLQDSRTQPAQTRQELLHPTLPINNTSQTIRANTSWLVGSVPDTFTYHLEYTASGSVTYAFLTTAEYVRFATCDTGLFYMTDRRVSKLVGCLNITFNGQIGSRALMPGPDRYGAGTVVALDFHYAEGCAGWVEVEFPSFANQSAQVTPNISVTYAPSSQPTAGYV
jgi:hypothetical protein